MSERNVRVETADSVCTITFDRPKKKNAFTIAMYEEIVAAMRAAKEDPKVRVLLFVGAEGTFTAGNDLMDFAQNPPKGTDTPVFQLLLELASFPKPLVAAVQGAAVGVGVTMLLHCDLVYVAEDAKLVMPFVNLGLVPEGASTLMLPKTAGRLLANELLLFGEPFDGATALRAGLANEVLPAAEVHARALARCQALAQKPAASLRLSKQLLRDALGDQVEGALTREGEIFLKRLTSPEAGEAFAAFMQKRKPDFSQFD